MPIIKSAKKRVRVAEKASIRNSKTKRSLRTAIKAFHKALTGGEKTTVVADLHSDAQSNLDKAVKKGVMHKNKAARQKSQLAARAKAAAAAEPAKKPAAKKAAAPKKAVVAKKATAAKKPAAKKPVAKKVTK